eukprot:SAG31_NODE_6530_length_1986_cov_2.842077_1_plen_321_part_00
MDEEQRYLLDLQGFLLVKSVLSDEELAAAQDAAGRYADAAFAASQAGLPDGFGQKGARSSNLWCGVAFDKALEWLCWHPRIWPLILELTDNRPQMNGPGTMIVDDLQHSSTSLRMDEPEPEVNWHCAREIGDQEDGSYDAQRARAAACCEMRDGKLRCNNFVCFPYLDTVEPGDGGLVILCGSHKSQFSRKAQSPTLFQSPEWTKLPGQIAPPPGVAHITPSAGDYVIMPEATVHGVLRWRAATKRRRVLVLRFQPQDAVGEFHGTPNLADQDGGKRNFWHRLSPHTHELMAAASRHVVKTVVARPPRSAAELSQTLSRL